MYDQLTTYNFLFTFFTHIGTFFTCLFTLKQFHFNFIFVPRNGKFSGGQIKKSVLRKPNTVNFPYRGKFVGVDTRLQTLKQQKKSNFSVHSRKFNTRKILFWPIRESLCQRNAKISRIFRPAKVSAPKVCKSSVIF